MNPDTLIVVCAYAGDKAQVETNMPLYLHHECPVVIMSPADAAIIEVSAPGVHCQWAGLRGWIGPHTLERQRKHMEMMLTFPQNHFLCHDADSICLSPQLPKYLYDSSNVIWSNEVLDTNPAPSLLPKIAMQPPYFLSRATIQGMLKAAENPPPSFMSRANPDDWPLPFPTECVDHFMLQISHGSGYPHASFRDGASFETESPIGRSEMARHVRELGKIFIHSVKTKAALDVLIEAMAEYQRSHR